MTSRMSKTATTKFTIEENIIRAKKAANTHNIIPKGRAPLGDVSNKITYQVKNETEKHIMRKIGKPPMSIQHDKPSNNLNKNNRCNNKIGDNCTSYKPKKDLKSTSSEASTLSKQLQIYDPDENTKNDPNAVTEYLEDIFSHLRNVEAEHKIEKDFLLNHETSTSMREILIDWIVELQVSFKLCIETLHLSISILDRYLSINKNVGASTLQLVGVTAVMIACKYEEIQLPDLYDFVYVCDDCFSSQEIIATERDILTALNFYLGCPTPILFLRRYSKIAKATALQHSLGKYLLELSLLDCSICHILPSHLAAAACCLSIAILDDKMDLTEVWNPTLVHYTTYQLVDFRHVIISLAKILMRTENYKHQTIQSKYAEATCGKISLNAKLKGSLVKKLANERDE